MDPELLAQLQQLYAQQDATASPPQQGPPGRGRSILGALRDAGDAIGQNTLGYLLTGLTSEPGSEQGQQFERSMLGLGADFMPGVGDYKAVAHDAPELFAEGHPILGGLALASAVPIVGAPLDAARKMMKARHFGPQVRHLDQLDPAMHGTGLRGAERQRQAAFPEEFEDRTYFYLGDTPPEPGLRGKPFVELDVPVEDFAAPEQFTRFQLEAQKQLEAEGRAVVPDLLMSRAEKLLKESGEFEGYFDPRHGVLVKFTPTELPLGRSNREIIEATQEFDGATFSTEGQNLAGEPLFSVTRPTPDGRKDWMTLEPGQELNAEHLNTFRERFADELADPEASIGTWRDPETGRTAIDIVETIPDRADALRRAEERGQDAIFDLGSMEEIRRTPNPDELFGPGSQSPLQYLGELGAPTDLPPRETARAAAGARLRRDRRSVASRARRVEAIESGLTPEELSEFRGLNRRTRAAVEENYSRLPEPEVFAQAAIRGAESRGWYRGSGEAIKESFGAEAPRFTALLAAMSPQKSVEENLRIALNTWGDWNRAGRPTDEAGLRAAIDSNLEADIGNAMRALSASDADVGAGIPSLLNGPKVGPFYANLHGVVDPVVNDTHMARGYGTMPGGVGTKGRTIAQNAMVRNAAKEFERITGQAVDPRELQEMSWSYIRGLTNAAGDKGKALETIEAAILKPETAFAGGQALDERVRNSVSIGHLMAQPEFAPSLERAGVAAPTPRAPGGTPGVDPLSADPNALRDVAERIDLVRSGNPLYTIAPLLAGAGIGAGAAGQRENR
jgi:hypothetical protein